MGGERALGLKADGRNKILRGMVSRRRGGVNLLLTKALMKSSSTSTRGEGRRRGLPQSGWKKGDLPL